MKMISATLEPHDSLPLGQGLWPSRFLSAEERSALEKAVVSSRSVGARRDLVSERARVESLFILKEGWAARYTITRGGGRYFLTLLVPGDLCNPDSLLIDRLDYGVRTLTGATVVALPRDQVSALAFQHPGIARMFLWRAFVDNAILGRSALALSRQTAKERLAHLLCELSVRLNAAETDNSSFDFPLTQEQIADALGLTSIHVNRTMRSLRAEGLVAIANRTMTLPDVARLRHISGFDPSYLHIDPSTIEPNARVADRQSATTQIASFRHLGG